MYEASQPAGRPFTDGRGLPAADAERCVFSLVFSKFWKSDKGRHREGLSLVLFPCYAATVFLWRNRYEVASQTAAMS